MVPRAVQDAGYTAVGLGVLALQQVQIRQREIAEKLSRELGAAARQAQSVVAQAKATAAPVTGVLDHLPRIPGPVGALVDEGRARLVHVLRPAS
jgi:hypothetical protein